ARPFLELTTALWSWRSTRAARTTESERSDSVWLARADPHRRPPFFVSCHRRARYSRGDGGIRRSFGLAGARLFGEDAARGDRGGGGAARRRRRRGEARAGAGRAL